MDFFHSKIHFAKLSNLMPCINKLYLWYHNHITPRTSCDSLPLSQNDENIILYLTHFVVVAANGHHTLYYGRTIHVKVSEIASRKSTVFLRPCEPRKRLLYCLCVIHREKTDWCVRVLHTRNMSNPLPPSHFSRVVPLRYPQDVPHAVSLLSMKQYLQCLRLNQIHCLSVASNTSYCSFESYLSYTWHFVVNEHGTTEPADISLLRSEWRYPGLRESFYTCILFQLYLTTKIWIWNWTVIFHGIKCEMYFVFNIRFTSALRWMSSIANITCYTLKRR